MGTHSRDPSHFLRRIILAMFDNPEVKVSLPNWLALSSRPLGDVEAARLRTPEQGGRMEARAAEEEVFVVDDRSSMSAAQMVENKLTRILKDASLPVSHLQMRNLLRSR
jgi:hypothetical protein